MVIDIMYLVERIVGLCWVLWGLVGGGGVGFEELEM